MSGPTTKYLQHASETLKSAPEPRDSLGGLAGRIAVVDTYHQALFGEHMWQGAIRTVAELATVQEGPRESSALAILDTRPERWLEAVQLVFSGNHFHELVIISAQHPLIVIETLAESSSPAATVDIVAVRRGRFITGLRRQNEDDLAIGPLLAGLRAGIEPAVRRTRDELVDAQHMQSSQVANLTKELAESRRRYTSLSRSVLGRVTLKYWALRRRLRS